MKHNIANALLFCTKGMNNFVILENVYKYIERGFTPIKAAIEGTKEVSFAVIAMTLTLCAVYAPVALAKGETGKYFSFPV